MPSYDEEAWINDAIGEGWKKDVCVTLYGTSYDEFKKTDYWKFCEGLRKHLTFIVDELEKGGIYII